MSELLVVKTSSLGDVVHNFPAVSDVIREHPQIKVDWVVEEAFAPLPGLHPGVRQVIPVALRRWRKAWFDSQHRAQISACVRGLRAHRYDWIVDTQGLLKSAVVTRLARGERIGYDRASAREPLASCFYDRGIAVSKDLHAVERNRRLAAAALGYSVSPAVEYGIRAPKPTHDAAPSEPYAVLLHGTSRPDKQWPQPDWVALAKWLRSQARSRELANAIAQAQALPATDLGDIAALLAGARIVIGVDTGLSHLACAFGVPTIGLFCGSDPALTGLYGSSKAVNLGRKGYPPAVAAVIAAAESLIAAC
jgi:heptosyltransferase I